MSVVITGFSGPKVSTRGKLVEKVCRAFGIDSGNDTEGASTALDLLDEVVMDLNTYVWEFMRNTQTGITLTASTQSYTLSTAVHKENQAYLNYTTDSEDQPALTFKKWNQFKKDFPSNKLTTGTPLFYSIYNINREGKVYLYPLPDSTIASDYTLTVEYYKRIALISSVGSGSSIDAPEELDPVLVYGAVKRWAIILDDMAAADRYTLLEREALDRLKRIDRTDPDAQLRFRLEGTFPNQPWKRSLKPDYVRVS